MIGCFKKLLIRLLSFSGSLVTKRMSSSNEHCKTRPFLIDINHSELK